MMTLISASVFAKVARGEHSRKAEESEQKPRSELNLEERNKMRVLSSLISQASTYRKGGQLQAKADTYHKGGQMQERAIEQWTRLGYEKQELLETDGYEENDIHGARKIQCEVQFMVLRRLARLRGANEPQELVGVPHSVVVIRGTDLSCTEDLAADVHHFIERLHKTEAYKTVFRMTRTTVDMLNNQSVCIAGHSLGGALGLIVGRELALDRKFVETHLFGPLSFTVDTLVRKTLAVGESLVAQLPGLVQKTVSDISEVLKEKIDRSNDDSERVVDYRKRKEEEFHKLRDWVPNLYVNPHDVICNEFIFHFDRQANLPEDDPRRHRRSSSELGSCISRFTYNDHTSASHLIPSATLYINHKTDPRNKKVCHKLIQWYTPEDHISLRREKHRLILE